MANCVVCGADCLQEYVFENGPLPPETTLNYSYQLFEALDYLHQELRVIHCDIKRERGGGGRGQRGEEVVDLED